MNEKNKTGKKNRKKLIVYPALLALAFTGAAFTACFGEPVQGEEYEYTYNMPFAPETDAFMNVDGKLDEVYWQDKNEMVHTEQGATITAKTVFTQKGVYVGLKAYDTDVQYNRRNNFHQNSSFSVRLVKEGEPSYDEWNYVPQHPMRNFDFNIDAETSRSWREVQYVAKGYCEGELNSGNTQYLSAELFLTWESMHYTAEELGENGYPETVRIFISYRKSYGINDERNVTIIPTYCEDWRYDTFYRFTENGFYAVYDDEVLGNADNGLCATDGWTVQNGEASHQERGTQIIWFKELHSENFVLETTAVPGAYEYMEAHTTPALGLITAKDLDSYSIYSFASRDLLSNAAGAKKLTLSTARYADGMQALEQIGKRETVISDALTDEVKLKLIKRGSEFYYFYNDKFWFCETLDQLSGEAFGGLFASDLCTFTDYSFTDYTGRTDELDEIISEYVYRISVPGKTAYGMVTVDTYIVKKGESVILSIVPESGYLFTSVEQNDTEIYDDVIAAYDNGYTFTPDCDVEFTVKFVPFPKESSVEVFLPVKETGTDNTVIGTTYTVSDVNYPVFTYTGIANPRGNIIVTLPKAGTYNIDGKEITVSGEYRIKMAATGYDEQTASFVLNAETAATGEYEQTVYLPKARYGKVTLNGVSIAGRGTFIRNDETGNYYVENNAFKFFTDTVDGDYEIEANILFEGTNAAVSGIALFSGTRCIVLKSCYWEVNRLCLAITDTGGYNYNGYEISVSGFTHNITSEGGSISLTVKRCGNVIGIYNEAGEAKIYLSEYGISFVNGATATNSSKWKNMGGEVKKFIAAGTTNAVGMAQYDKGHVEFDISYQAKDGITLSPGDFDFATDTNEYTAVYEKSLICGNGFAQGSTVYVKVYSKDEVKVAKTLTLSGGGNEFNVEGTYFADEDATVFEFVYDKAYAATVTLATRIRISGKVNVPDGVDASSVQVETSDGNVYHGAVNANGEFNLLLLAGTYDFRFSASEYAAYLLGYTVDGESAPLNVTLVSAICELGSTGTVNGNKVNAEGTTVNDFAFRADSMDGSVSDLGDGKIYLLPNTATSEDFVFSVTMTQINRFAGMGITDGKMNLSFQVVSWEKDGRNLIMELSTWMSETIVEIVIPVNPNTIDEATYTIAKTGETITLYAGTGDKTVWLAILTPDGILLNGGSLIERSANGKTSAQRFAIQELYLNSFLVQGKEYMAMLIRNEVVLTGSSVTKAAYEYSFTKGSGNVQVFLEVPAGVNAINGTATFRTDKTAYTFDVTSSEFTVNLPYGVYEYEVEVSGYAVGNGKGTLTLDGNATIDNMVLIERAVGPELYVTEETADSITLSWMENAQHESYQIMRVVGSGNATATTVLADSAEGAFAATDGWFVYKIEGDAFVSGAKYVVVTTPRAGYVAPENVAVTATPYSKGVLFDASVDEMMTRVAVSGDGVDVSYDGGIKLQGDGEKTVRVNINRSFDLSGVNYLSVQVSATGSVTLAGISKNVSGKTWFNLTPAQYNGGSFYVTFNGSLVLLKVETDAVDDMREFEINGNTIATQAGTVEKNDDGTWTSQSTLMLRFYRKKMEGDFTVDIEFIFDKTSGQSGIVFNTGVKTAEALAIKAVPWENKIVIMRGWNTAEISVNGIELDFTYDAGTNTYSGTAHLKIARIGDRLYIYDKYGVKKVILGGENSIELVNGASFNSGATIPDEVKTAIETYFANTSAQESETALGLWCDVLIMGKLSYKVDYNDDPSEEEQEGENGQPEEEEPEKPEEEEPEKPEEDKKDYYGPSV